MEPCPYNRDLRLLLGIYPDSSDWLYGGVRQKESV